MFNPVIKAVAPAIASQGEAERDNWRVDQQLQPVGTLS
jgi:hypothetical protein